MKTKEILNNELQQQKINLKNTTNAFFERNYILSILGLLLFSCLVMLPIFFFENDTIFDYLTFVLCITPIIIIFQIFLIHFIYYKKYLAMQVKLSKINWLKLYVLESNNIVITNVCLNKFNISRYELNQLLVKKKINNISINNSITCMIKDQEIKFIYNKIELSSDSNDLILSLKMVFNSKQNNDIFNEIKDKIIDVVEFEQNKLIKLKIKLFSVSEFENKWVCPRNENSFWTRKIDKNFISEFNQNIIGQFYAVSHNKKNFLDKYVLRIKKDIEIISKFTNV